MGILDISQLVSFPTEEQLARAYLQPIDLAPGETPPWAEDDQAQGNGTNHRWALSFQYWPGSVSDTRQAGWQSKPVPGGSHPIREWPGGGDRTITFTVAFSTDSAPPFDAFRDENGVDLADHDLDIRMAISWLRWFTYPHYGETQDQEAYPPPKALLVMTGMRLGHTGVDYVVVTMDQCDITYIESFPEGIPKIAEVSLTFTESVVHGYGARFHDRANFGPARRVGDYLSQVDFVGTTFGAESTVES